MIAERVLNRLAEQDRVAAVAPPRVAGRAVLLTPHRGENPDEAAPPAAGRCQQDVTSGPSAAVEFGVKSQQYR
ncbi:MULTISPECIES: hypothetical protein [unclassified Streptomyces]|uniref:hypothetical protein n=1 Tax=unclassified Streptomyces TaxID=2593676 RepID=UPI0033AA6885